MGRKRSAVAAGGMAAADLLVRGVPEDDEDDEEPRKDEEDEDEEDLGEGYSE